MRYHVTSNGTQHGPFSEDEIRKEVQAGRFSFGDRVWADGMPDWVPMSDVISPGAPTKPTKSQAGGASMKPVASPTNPRGTSGPIAQLGQSYKASFFAGDGISKTSIELTADRISGRGKTYTATSKEGVSFMGDLKSVSSIGMDYHSSYILLVLGVILLVAYGLGILFLIAYYMTKERFIVVNFEGFTYALSLRGIRNKDVDQFVETAMVAIHAAKA